MKRTLAIVTLAACLSTAGADALLAQGRGPGAGRGLGSAANSAAAAGQGMGRSSQAISRGNSYAGGAAAATNRSANALQRSGSLSGQPAANHARIEQHRIAQADHLRSLSERNGNESLMGTADRMQASASTNYQRQSTLAPSEGGMAETASAAAAIAPTRQPAGGKRGFWFRSR